MGVYIFRAATIIWLSAAFCGLTGCNADIRLYCKDVAECEGLSAADEDACVAALKGDRQSEDAYGCRDEFDDYYACAVDNGFCASDPGIAESYYSVGADESGYPNCMAEETALDSCGAIESNW